MHILPLSLKITQSGVNFSEYSPAVGFPRLLKTLCVKLTFRHQRHLLLLTGVMSSSMISLLKETRRECCSSCLYLEAKKTPLFLGFYCEGFLLGFYCEGLESMPGSDQQPIRQMELNGCIFKKNSFDSDLVMTP